MSEMSDGSIVRSETSVTSSAKREKRHQEGKVSSRSLQSLFPFLYMSFYTSAGF